jgi:hypothetical protein
VTDAAGEVPRLHGRRGGPRAGLSLCCGAELTPAAGSRQPPPGVGGVVGAEDADRRRGRSRRRGRRAAARARAGPTASPASFRGLLQPGPPPPRPTRRGPRLRGPPPLRCPPRSWSGLIHLRLPRAAHGAPGPRELGRRSSVRQLGRRLPGWTAIARGRRGGLPPSSVLRLGQPWFSKAMKHVPSDGRQLAPSSPVASPSTLSAVSHQRRAQGM